MCHGCCLDVQITETEGSDLHFGEQQLQAVSPEAGTQGRRSHFKKWILYVFTVSSV